MSRFRFTLALVFAAALLAAVTLPLVLTAGSASAKGKPVVITFSDVSTEFNPCTLAEEDVVTTLTLRIHEFELNDPDRHHFNVQFRLDIETSGGFSGFGVGPDIDNGAGLFGAETRGTFTSIFNGKLRNESGQMVSLHGNFHVTEVGGELRAFVNNFRETCVGKPS